MPHVRKHLKLTGDTHPPEVADDLGPDEEEPALPAAVATASSAEPATASAAVPTAKAGGVRSIVVAMPARQYVDATRDQVRARPLATAAWAFFAGFAMAVVTRSR